MKEEKGITLITLIAYVIVLLIVISVVTTVTHFLMNNINEIQDGSKNMVEINKFDVVFLADIKKTDTTIYPIEGNDSVIVLEYADGTDIQYLYKDNAIYRTINKGTRTETMKVCEKIEKFYIKAQTDEQIDLTIQVKGENELNKMYKVGQG